MALRPAWLSSVRLTSIRQRPGLCCAKVSLHGSRLPVGPGCWASRPLPGRVAARCSTRRGGWPAPPSPQRMARIVWSRPAHCACVSARQGSAAPRSQAELLQPAPPAPRWARSTSGHFARYCSCCWLDRWVGGQNRWLQGKPARNILSDALDTANRDCDLLQLQLLRPGDPPNAGRSVQGNPRCYRSHPGWTGAGRHGRGGAPGCVGRARALSVLGHWLG